MFFLSKANYTKVFVNGKNIIFVIFCWMKRNKLTFFFGDSTHY